MVYKGTSYKKKDDDLGVPPCMETSVSREENITIQSTSSTEENWGAVLLHAVGKTKARPLELMFRGMLLHSSRGSDHGLHGFKCRSYGVDTQ